MTETKRRRPTPEPPTPRSQRYILDSNAFAVNGGITSDDVDFIIEQEECLGRIFIGNRAAHEIHDQRTPAHLRRLAVNFLFIDTSAANDNAIEAQRRSEIRVHFRGHASDNRHDADADIMFDAEKYVCRYLVTDDNRFAARAKSMSNGTVAVIGANEFMAALRSSSWSR